MVMTADRMVGGVMSRRGGRRGGLTHDEESDHQTPGFIRKLQKTIEVRPTSGGGGGGHFTDMELSESGYGEDAW